MTGSKAMTWIWGAVLVCLLLAVAAWFALISPLRDSTSALREQTESLVSANDQKQIRIQRLAAEAEQLDTRKAELAALRTQVPSDDGLSGYLRQLTDAAAARSVTITAMSPAEPVSFSPVIATSADETMSGAGVPAGTAEETSATATATTSTSAASGSAPVGMVAIPVTISAQGGYFDVLEFINDVQQSGPRLTLVTTVAGTALEAGPGDAGHGPTHEGDLQVTLTGDIFVLPSAVTTAASATTDTEVALPGRVPGKNPLIPVG